MENKETKESIFSKIQKETKKSGFIKALMVFFFCVISSLIVGFIYDNIQLSVTLGIGLGLVWMGVAYFNQKE
jgi:mannose/fructose/N-acetylgalactosamine-specific phosphotransferase system component IIC